MSEEKPEEKSIDNPESLEGATPKEVEEVAEKEGFTEKNPLKKGEGTRLSDPKRSDRTVQINQGYPGSSGVHGGPYVKITGKGQTIRIPLSGILR